MVVLLLVTTLEHVEWSTLGAEEDGTELKLTLHGEVLHGGMLLPIVGDGLVESSILVLGNIIRLAHPDGLHIVEMFPLMANFLDLLSLLFLLLIIFIDFLNLGLVIITLLVFIIVIIIGNFLLGSLFSVELDGEAVLIKW